MAAGAGSQTKARARPQQPRQPRLGANVIAAIACCSAWVAKVPRRCWYPARSAGSPVHLASSGPIAYLGEHLWLDIQLGQGESLPKGLIRVPEFCPRRVQTAIGAH